MAVNFCKMLPYAGTQIERELAEAGRLKGTDGFIDYDFRDESLNHLFSHISGSFYEWIMSRDGLLSLQRWTRYYLATYRKFFPADPEFDRLRRKTDALIDECNRFMLATLVRTCDVFEFGKPPRYDAESLASIRSDIDSFHSAQTKKLDTVLSGIKTIAAGQGCETASR
jgi:hypothetical protein